MGVISGRLEELHVREVPCVILYSANLNVWHISGIILFCYESSAVETTSKEYYMWFSKNSLGEPRSRKPTQWRGKFWKSYEDAHKLLWLKLLHPLNNLRPGSLSRLRFALIVHDNSRLCDLLAWSFLESGD